MLVVHPNSTCDVCLDNYSSGAQSPHTITCGHVFCHGCLDSLPKPICPLCRTRFEAEDIRKLHIDRGQTPRTTSLAPTDPEGSSPDAEFSQEARRYQTEITRIVKDGAPASELRALIDHCHVWLKSQPHDQHEDLRVSFLLLYNLTETQRKLAAETEAVRGLQADCESLRAQIDTERDAAERKYADLERCNADEKETALAVEKSLRDHYEKLNSEWQQQYDAVYAACKRLEDELKHAKYPYNSEPESSHSVDMRYFYTPENRMDTSEPDEQPMKVDEYCSAKLRKLPNDDVMFHLSPLPVNIPPLPSAVLGFSALAEEDDDVKNIRDKAKSMDYDHLMPQHSTKPIPIPMPKKPHAPRVSSGLAISVPKTLDLWGSDIPRPFPLAYEVAMDSCSSSPMTGTEPSIRDRPSVFQPVGVKSSETSPPRRYPYHEERREPERHSIDQRERAGSFVRDRPSPSQTPEVETRDTSPNRRYPYHEERREHERHSIDQRERAGSSVRDRPTLSQTAEVKNKETSPSRYPYHEERREPERHSINLRERAESVRDRPTSSQAPEVPAKEPSPSRRYPYNDERDPLDHKRVQLHDLLDNQKSSSLPTNSQLQSILSPEMKPTPSRSYSLQAVSRTPPPPNPNASPSPSTSAKPSPPSTLSQSHGSHHSASTRPAAISHASSAAIQLERERHRAAEKERENARERERGSSSSLRNTTNAHHRMGSIGNGKAKMPVYA